MSAMESTKLRFRIATPDDAPAVTTLIQNGFSAPDSRPNWTGNLTVLMTNSITTVDDQLKNINNPDMILFLMEDQAGFPLATIAASRRDSGSSDGGGGGHTWLSLLAVDTSRQQSGLGRTMLEYAEQHCQQAWGFDKVKLNTLSTRGALTSWYERRGYRRDGTTKPFPVNDEKFEGMGLPSDLHFINLEKDLALAHA